MVKSLIETVVEPFAVSSTVPSLRPKFFGYIQENVNTVVGGR